MTVEQKYGICKLVDSYVNSLDLVNPSGESHSRRIERWYFVKEPEGRLWKLSVSGQRMRSLLGSVGVLQTMGRVL
jgi:hypothetical protein